MADGDAVVLAQIAADTQANAAKIRFVDEADPPNPVHLATSEKQDTGNSSLSSIAGKDFATQTTLAALNTKFPSDPPREGGNLSTIAAKDFATQTTLAALLGKFLPLSRSDVYTAVATGTRIDATNWFPLYYSILVSWDTSGDNGVPTAWGIVLEGSLDGTNFETILTHSNTTGNNRTLSTTNPAPYLYFRSRLVSQSHVTGTISGTVTIVGR